MGYPKASAYKAGGMKDMLLTADKAGGSVLAVDHLAGVTTIDKDNTETVSCLVEGVIEVDKVGTACVAGKPAYFDNDGDPYGGTTGTGACTPLAKNGDFCMGVFEKASTTGQGKAYVRLNTQALIASLINIIADPGDAGAIPVVKSGSVSLVSTTAQTRTLAIPSFIGQKLNIGFKTDAGDVVVTVASAVDQAGKINLTFADAGDQLSLVAIEKGSALAWRIESNDGVALAT